MTKALFTDTLGLREGITVLVNEQMHGVQGVFVGMSKREGRTRIKVKVTDVGNSSLHIGDHPSDWAENWRTDDVSRD